MFAASGLLALGLSRLDALAELSGVDWRQNRAWLVLLYWFFLQLLAGLTELGPMRNDVSSGVAVWAHVGGFVAGVVLVRLFENPKLIEQRTRARMRVPTG